ncbi:unnamed protein product [Rotaria socialis]|uniref:Uncharacterized protein n=1 Tax=Rotaria socialis TaxID=392032 RepID=A0A820VDB3_9BILA|nr:unnamed protein product [Rotaria socialis]
MFYILYVFIYSLLLSLLDQVKSQACQGATQYDQCSSNIACGCLPLMNIDNSSICVLLHVKCSDLVSCAENSRVCYRPAHQCVRHPQCHSTPVCYPEAMALQVLCPPIPATTTPSSVVPDDGICENAIWNINGATVAGGNGEGSYTLDVQQQVVPDDGICENAIWNINGATVAGGNGVGSALNQLSHPEGLFMDGDAAIYIADTWNDRVVKWELTCSHMSSFNLGLI